MLLVDNSCYKKKSIAVYTNHFLFTGGNTTEDLEMTVVLVCFVLQLYFVMLIISQCVSKNEFLVVLFQELWVEISDKIILRAITLCFKWCA